MKIIELKAKDQSDVAEVITEDGTDFYFRFAYLSELKEQDIYAGASLNAEQAEELVDAGLAFAAERKAEDYLARCEQSRAGLEKKLSARNHSRQAVKAALDYLESRNLLNDVRFSSSWLRGHTITKPQGRIRLLSELLSRGISQQDARQALEEFFELNDEEELCQRCYQKAVKNGKKDEKLVKYMIDSGFSYKMVIKIKEDN